MAVSTAISDRDRVLEATDLVALVGEHVALRPKGREHVGLCPFHEDRTPSLAVVTHKGSAFYKCFSCGAAGNAIDFMMNYHRLDFVEALRTLAQRAGIELRRPSAQERRDREDPAADRALLIKANAMAQRFYRRSLEDAGLGAAARAAVAERRLEATMVERFGLGCAPDGWDHFVKEVDRHARHARDAAENDRAEPLSPAVFEAAGLIRAGKRGPIDGFRNRITFPICDELGNPVAFGARKIVPEDEPKYLNSPESAIFHKSRALYGIHLAKRAIISRKCAIVCEGYTDVIACHAAGFDWSVATLGTALTREHARILQRMGERVILLFDGDEAGQKAADRAVEVFFAEPIDVCICTLPDDLDPDELLRQPEGRSRFDAALAASVDAVEYQVRRFRMHWKSASGLSGRQQRLEAMLARLASLGLANLSGIRKHMVLAALSDLTGLREEELEKAMPKATPPAARAGIAADARVGSDARAGAGAAAGDASSSASNPAPAAPLTPHARARVEAERNLLALLLADPALALESIEIGEGTTLPLTEAFPVETFSDPCLLRVATALWHEAESGNRVSLQTILAELPEQVDKRAASDLFSTGAARIERPSIAGETAFSLLKQAASDLERLLRRERYSVPERATDGPLDASSFVEQLERLRRRGPHAAAIARGVRSNPS